MRIRKPDDMHIHLRQGEYLGEYLEICAKHFARAVIMPNTIPAISTPGRLMGYRDLINLEIEKRFVCKGFIPLMTFKLTENTTIKEIQQFKDLGCMIAKYYPAGATTNSNDGITNFRNIYTVLEEMERQGVVLSIHAEDPLAPILEREKIFFPIVKRLAEDFKNLKIIIEHISSQYMLERICRLRNGVYASITAHHICFCFDDMFRGGINPHLYCFPILKTRKDQEAIGAAATSGDPRFFFGSDSAPHARNKKESGMGAAGIFASPVCLSLLIEYFITKGKESILEYFLSEYGARAYGIPLNDSYVNIVERPYTVPMIIGDAIPLMAGSKMYYSIDNI